MQNQKSIWSCPPSTSTLGLAWKRPLSLSNRLILTPLTVTSSVSLDNGAHFQNQNHLPQFHRHRRPHQQQVEQFLTKFYHPHFSLLILPQTSLHLEALFLSFFLSKCSAIVRSSRNKKNIEFELRFKK